MKQLLIGLAAALYALIAPNLASGATSNTPWSAEIWQMKLGTLNIGPPYTGPNAKQLCQASAHARSENAAVSGTYFCHGITGARITYTASCTAQPSTTTATIACGAGLAPPWDQTTTVTVSAPPACTVTTTLTPPTAPAGACQPIAPPPIGTVYYFSDCQPGAAPGCTPGDNANPGTQALPKQNLTGISVNALPAGSALFFARGGAWTNFDLYLHNLNVTLAAPLVIDAYGVGPSPLLRGTGPGSNGESVVQLGGNWGNTSDDGGYTFRNVTIDGMGVANRGMWFVQRVRGITLENVDLIGSRFGIESSLGIPGGVTGVTIRNSRISNNRSMGILGSYSNSLIENNTFEANNQITGSSGNHAIYFSHGDGVVIRNNQFTNNSVVNGSCIGGNVTAHGQVDGLLIEGNTITVPATPASAESCYGFAITVGYTTAEWFRNVVIRGNTIINVGRTSIAANAAPGILVENNRIIKDNATEQYGIWIPANGGGNSEDVADGNAIVRNNTICYTQLLGSQAVVVTAPDSQVSGNVLRTGADASTGVCAR